MTSRIDKLEFLLLNAIIIMENRMAQDISDLKATVQANSDVVAKAVTQLNALAAGSVDPADLAAVTAQIKASNDALTAALTPAAPAA